MKRIRHAVAAVLLGVLAACGGGSGGPAVTGLDSALSAGKASEARQAGNGPAREIPGQSCGFEHVWITVERLRAVGDRVSHEIVLPQPRRIDLMAPAGGLLDELGAPPLPAGQYRSLQLVLAANGPAGAADSLANAVQPVGGNPLPLATPAASQSGLKLPFDVELGPEQEADVELLFDVCESVLQAGRSGRFLLKPVVNARLRLPRFIAPPLELVNSTTAGNQFGPRVAVLASGGYMVVWSQVSGDPSTFFDIYGQRFDPAGRKVGGEVRLYAGGIADAVTGLPAGGFAIAISSQVGGVGQVLALRFTDSGVPLGSAQTVLTSGQAFFLLSNADDIHAVPGGGFLVTARISNPRPPPFETYYARRFDANGQALGELLQLQDTFGAGGTVSSTVLPNGNWVFAWKEIIAPFAPRPQSNIQVFARLFNSADAPIATLNPNPNAEADENHPGTATLKDGRFVLAWSVSPFTAGTALPAVQLQLFDQGGGTSSAVIGLETPPIVGGPKVTPLADGGFLVSVARAPQAGEDASIVTVLGQYFDATGRASGRMFTVGTARHPNASPSPSRPGTWSIAPLPDGGFVFATQLPTAGSGEDIYQRRFVRIGL